MLAAAAPELLLLPAPASHGPVLPAAALGGAMRSCRAPARTPVLPWTTSGPPGVGKAADHCGSDPGAG
eukprot:9367018-Heterocapsa_arctica.AAC.1